MLCLLLTLTLLSSVCGYSTWNGQYTMTTAATVNNNQGRVNAFVSWSWTTQKMRFGFGTDINNPRWSETYQFNKNNLGWAQAPTSQFLFTFGTTCNPNCASSGLSNAMPPFDIALSTTYLNAPTTISGGTCGAVRRYTPKAGVWVHSVVSFDTTADGTICNFVLTDGRTFNLVPGTFSANSNPTITAPSGCTCNQAIDIMFLIDRSSSISGDEMATFRSFVTQFLSGLTIATDAVWVGMSYFSTSGNIGVTFPMTGSNTSVYAGINLWGRECPVDRSKADANCYGAGTCTSGGMRKAASALYEKAVRNVPKLIVTLTDGGQNQKTDGSRCDSINGAPGTSIDCDPSINSAMSYAKGFATALKPLTFICAGIGTACSDVNSCLSPKTILQYADGVIGNNLTISGFSALSGLTESLMQQTCTSSNNIASTTCQDTCCGLCVCGVCQAPDSCGSNLCETYTLGSTCCSATPISTLAACGIPASCSLKSCNRTANNGAGGCVTSPQVCNVANSGCNDCITWGCNPATSTCTLANTSACAAPVDCVYNDWNAWSQCTKTCGGGTTTHTRTISLQASNCGLACDVSTLTTTAQCATNPCPIPCVWSPWSAFDVNTCTASCGTGTMISTRTVITQAANGAQPCGSVNVTVSNCNTQLCPVDCAWGAWSAYTPCTKSCGGGQQWQNRSFNPPAANGGLPCLGLSNQSRMCNVQGCPVDCKYSDWTDFSLCSQLCLNTLLQVPILGVSVRTRVVLVVGINGGTLCDNSTTNDTDSCNTNPCAIPCTYGAWSAFGNCSVTCGTGTQYSTRTVNQTAAYGGAQCNSNNTRSQTCEPRPCPVPCSYGNWADWSANTTCTAACEGGLQTRTRTYTAAQFGGTPCNTDVDFNSQSRACNTQACDRDCTYNDWGTWGPCTVSCGSGTQTQSRTVKNATTGNGVACNGDPSPPRACNTKECPIDCIIGSWTEWAGCNVTCGSGTDNRTRTLTPPQFGGDECPNDDEYRSCFPKECPIDCTGEWSQWSAANCNCQNRTQTIYYIVSTTSQFGGACPGSDIGSITNFTNCTSTDCDKPCVGSWSSYGPCRCSDSSSTRTYLLVSEKLGNGADCSPSVGTTQELGCTPEKCPVNCVGQWSEWAACNCNSGTGIRYKNWTIQTAAINGGAQCDYTAGQLNVTNADDCSSTCPTPCEGAWSDYGDCSCSTYMHNRTYTITKALTNGGAACPEIDNRFFEEPCNRIDCPVDCVGAFSPWGYCDCTTSKWNHTWEETTAAAYKGKPCDYTKDQIIVEDCTKLCVDCVGDFGKWAACDCASNTTQRVFAVTVQASGPPDAGVQCAFPNGYRETKSCVPLDDSPPVLCPVNCDGQWSSYGPCDCKTSTQTRNFTVTVVKQNAGTDCAQPDGTVSAPKTCTPTGCPVDCEGAFGKFDKCNCDTRLEERTYTITQADINGGAKCDNVSGTKDYQPCDPQYVADNCPVNCVWEWSAWNECSCKSSSQNRTVTVTTPAKNGGFPCPADNNQTTVDYQTCVPIECPEDCVGSWGPFGDCPCTNPPTWNKTYTISKPAVFGGAKCPAEDGQVDIENCTSYSCVINCNSSYSDYTDCSCTTRSRNRTYFIFHGPENGGLNCNATNNSIETTPCTPSTACPDYGPTCDNATECDDGKPCTVDACLIKPDGLLHCDNSQPTVCNDGSVCTSDICDPIAGCVFTQALSCNDFNLCTEDSCNPTTGCEHVNITCPDVDACFLGLCNPQLGCQVEERQCRNSTVANDTCLTYTCNANATNGKYCTEENTCAFPIVIVGIAAGAIAGIVCGAVICAALFSGATYALASQTTTLGAVATTTNPLYAPSGTAGDNPMFVETPRVDAGGA